MADSGGNAVKRRELPEHKLPVTLTVRVNRSVSVKRKITISQRNERAIGIRVQ
jgi:hypothetical protein